MSASVGKHPYSALGHFWPIRGSIYQGSRFLRSAFQKQLFLIPQNSSLNPQEIQKVSR